MKTKNLLLTSFSLLTVVFLCSILVSSVKNDNYIKKDQNFGFQVALAQSGNLIKFEWAEPKVDENIAFYKLHHGIMTGSYGEIIETKKANNSLALDISNFETYDHYFALSAVDVHGNESSLSGEVYINLDPEYINESNYTHQYCGNGLKEQNEVCDGGYRVCEVTGSFNGSYFGEQKCNNSCDGWEATCSPVEFCGDGILNGSEVCEKDMFDEEGNIIKEGDTKGCVTSSGTISIQKCNNSCDGWSTCEGL